MGVKIIAQRGKQMSAFTQCVNQLALVSGKDFQTVLEHEVARIMELAIGRTKKSDPGKILAHQQKQKMTLQRIDYGGPQSTKGRVIPPLEKEKLRIRAAARRSKDGGSLLYSLPAGPKHRHPAWLWAELGKRRRASLREKLRKIGLAAKHWAEIGRILNLPMNVPADVARAKNSRPLQVKATKGGKDKAFIIKGQNFSRLSVDYAGGNKALASAIRSRATAFNTAMKKQAAGKVNTLAKKYPELMKAA